MAIRNELILKLRDGDFMPLSAKRDGILIHNCDSVLINFERGMQLNERLNSIGIGIEPYIQVMSPIVNFRMDQKRKKAYSFGLFMESALVSQSLMITLLKNLKSSNVSGSNKA